MAVTKIWAIKKRLDNVVDYVVNEKKTIQNVSKQMGRGIC